MSATNDGAVGAQIEHGAGEHKPRLFIHSVTLENFKSYGGETVLGPFHKSFTSIVGPNGSGKSNTIDALQFVMGKRTSKMRLKRVSELIHKSENYPDCDMAKVSVQFMEIVDLPESMETSPENDGTVGDNNAYKIVPGSEFVVSRAAFSNNKSTYYIDHKRSTYTAVTELLKSKGIDLDHNRSMVLQGEVEQIAMMRPKGENKNDTGLLEFLEDIIGTNQYVEDIDSAFEDLERLNEERTSHLHRVKVVEKERESLQGAKLEAEAFMGKEQEILGEQNKLYQINRHEANLAHLVLNNKHEAAAAEASAATAEIEAAAADLGETETQFQEVTNDCNEIASRLEQTKKEFSAYERKDIKFREDLKHLKNKKKKLQKALDKHKADLARLSETMDAHAEDLERNEATVASVSEEHARETKVLEEMYAAIKDQSAGIQAQIHAIQEQLMPHKDAEAEVTAAINVARSEQKLIRAKREKLETARGDAAAAVESHVAVVGRKEQELAAMEASEKKARKRIGKLTKKIAVYQEQEAQLVSRIKASRGQVEEYKASQAAQKSQSSVLDGLLREKRKGRLSGVYGRLGDLGTIDDQYDVAISTACPQLNYIVVDTADTAQACVQFLRERRLGRATFIIIDQLADMSRAMAANPEAFPAARLFDLVEPLDGSFASAFYYALRDTLVAEDLETASEIAYQGRRRFRVVTLEGQLIDTSGTMSGGGRKVARGLMSGTSTTAAHAAGGEGGITSKEELQAVEAEVGELMGLLKEVRAEVAKLKGELAVLEAEVSEFEVNFTTANMDLEAARKAVTVAEERVAALAEQVAVTPEEEARYAELDEVIAGHEVRLTEIRGEMTEFQNQIAALQQEILDIGGMDLRVQKSSVEMLAKKLDMAEEAITKAKVGAKTTQKNIKKLERAVSKAEGELEQVLAQTSSTKAEFKEIEEQAVVVMQRFESIQALMDEKIEEQKTLKKTWEKKKKAVSTLKTNAVDVQNKVTEIGRSLNECHERVKRWTTQLAALHHQAEEVIGNALQLTGLEGAGTGGATVSANEVRARVAELLPEFAEEDLTDFSKNNIQKQIAVLEGELEAMSPNMTAIEEYRRKEEEYLQKVGMLDEVTQKRDQRREVWEELRKRRLNEFMEGFAAISLKLKELYQLVSGGGDAELELVDSLDPFASGVILSVRPFRKAWSSCSKLSGGEKTLASLALVFALHHYKPTPLYVMDEIDAALDFSNVARIGSIIRSWSSKDAQFIVISLRNNMFSLADRLVGIYKVHCVSSSVLCNPHAFSLGDKTNKSQEGDNVALDKDTDSGAGVGVQA